MPKQVLQYSFAVGSLDFPHVTGHSDKNCQIVNTKILEMEKEFSENDMTSDILFLKCLTRDITSFWMH